MPIYEYTCNKCNLQTEIILTIAKGKEPQECENCNSPLSRTYSITNIAMGKCFNGWHEHITKEPIYITSKSHLKDEILKHRGSKTLEGWRKMHEY